MDDSPNSYLKIGFFLSLHSLNNLPDKQRTKPIRSRNPQPEELVECMDLPEDKVHKLHHPSLSEQLRSSIDVD